MNRLFVYLANSISKRYSLGVDNINIIRKTGAEFSPRKETLKGFFNAAVI